MRIYRNIKLRCTASGITVSELERALGFTRGSLYKWDKNIPSVDRAAVVAKALHCTIEDLIRDG